MDFYKHLKTYLSDEQIVNLSIALKDEDLHAVILNTRKMSDEMFLSLFPDVIKHPIVPHAYIYKKDKYNLGKNIFYTLGCYYLQEPSAMVPAYLLDINKEDIIFDMCAAPGGKTVQASFKLDDTGLIIANDLSRSRCSAIVENIERLGLGNVVITNNDLSLIYKRYLNCFDKIILDAPCSGSGMFRKDSKMEQDWSYNKVLKFAETQKQLISIAYEMVKPGGIICYSTCSFSQEEDEDIIEYLLQNTDAEVVNIDHKLFFKNEKKPLGIHLIPGVFPGEGHYICLIKKPGNSVLKREKDRVSNNKYNLEFTKIYQFGDYLFGLNNEFNFKYFNVIRLGVKIGELIHDEIKHDYHYAHYTNNMQKYALDDNSLKLYFNGNTLNANLSKGYYLLTYMGINVDIAKSDGRIIKNHLPKVFRYKI